MNHWVIDIGNTRIKCALFENQMLQALHFFENLGDLDLFLVNNPKYLGIVCNVGIPEESVLVFLQQHTHLILFTRQTPVPISNQYQTPETLGLDRLAAAVGATTLFPDQAILIIDVGTALKIDYVLPKLGFMGGYISPGLRIRFEGLHTFTNKLPLVEPQFFDQLFGQSTVDCIRAGVMQGMLAEIQGMIQKYEELHPIQTVFSGGDAHFFESQIKTTKFTEPNLVLIGLHRILQHNVNEPNLVL